MPVLKNYGDKVVTSNRQEIKDDVLRGLAALGSVVLIKGGSLVVEDASS